MRSCHMMIQSDIWWLCALRSNRLPTQHMVGAGMQIRRAPIGSCARGRRRAYHGSRVRLH